MTLKKMNNIEIKNYGFIPDEIKPEDYMFGGFTKIEEEVLQENGQWDEYLPEKEIQHDEHFDTMNCTGYGTLNALEILFKKLGQDRNFSERYVGILANTTPQGNSPQVVIETIRKEAGLIPESELPFSEDIDSWEQYYSPKPMEPKYLAEGQNFLRQYTIGHEWVYFMTESLDLKKENLKEALKYSPIGVSVKAWQEKGGLYYKNPGQTDNHWCVLFGYKEGEYWLIFDSYDNTIKRLKWDYDFSFAKRYYITKNTQKKSNWLVDLIKRLVDFILGR